MRIPCLLLIFALFFLVCPSAEETVEQIPRWSVAIVRSHETGKYGAIFRDGTWAVEPKWDSLSPFSEGLAKATFGSLCGYISVGAKPGKFRWEEPLANNGNGWAIGADQGYFSSQGSFSHGRALVERRITTPALGDRKVLGFIDRSGKLVFSLDFIALSSPFFSEGVCFIRRRLVLPSKPDEAGEAKWQAINIQGNAVKTLEVDEVRPFSCGRAAFCRDDKWGFMTTAYSEIVKPMYDEVCDYADDRAAVRYLHGKWTFLDLKGSEIAKLPMPHVRNFSGGYAAVMKEDESRWSFINTDGEEALEPAYSNVGRFSEGLCAFSTGGMWGYMLPTGAVVVKERFSACLPFAHGLAGVYTEGKWGFISVAGTFTVEPVFEWASSFHDTRKCNIPLELEEFGNYMMPGR